MESIMKLNKIQALVLTLGVVLSSGAMFAGKAGAAPTASSTATFNGTVVPSVIITTLFTTPVNYTQNGTGPSGGTVSLTATTNAAFINTNADLADIAITGTTTRPVPTNATDLRADHFISFTYNGPAGTTTTPVQTTSGITPGGTITQALNNTPLDLSGNLTLTVTSSWSIPTPAGDNELFANSATNNYSATVTATVTPK